MIKNIVFDYGGVLVDWNPHYVFDSWFGGDVEKADWFLQHICNMEWNEQMDKGKPFSEGVAELSARYPEWKTEIEMYYRDWIKMINPVPIAGMTGYVRELKERGYKTYGLSNWAAETFAHVRHRFEAFDLLDGMVVSGYEKTIKPEPRIFEILFERYHLIPRECVFIDDNARNLAAARTMGMHTIQFTTKEALEGPLESLLAERS